MVSIRRRKRAKADKFVVDYRDGAGVRRLITCNTRSDAEHVAGEKMLEAGQAACAPAVDANVTVLQYAERFLKLLPTTAKPATCRLYGSVLTHHVLPALGWAKVRRLHQAQVRAFVATKAEQGLSAALLHSVLKALSSMLTAAVEDGVIRTNPAIGLRHRLRLFREASAMREDPKAMTRDQVARFLDKARVRQPELHPLFFLMARTGVRLGEAVGLQWPDVDLEGRLIRVRRTLAFQGAAARGERVGTPKSGKARTVDVSRELAALLRQCQRERRAVALRHGWGDAVAWVFADAGGQPLSYARVSGAFGAVLTAAGLPVHFTPHCLRHTYATLLLQDGAPITYVQAQLGHSSISMTLDVYGRWLPTGNRDLVDRLDSTRPATDRDDPKEGLAGARGDQTVTNFDSSGIRSPQVIDSIGSALPGSPSPQLTPM